MLTRRRFLAGAAGSCVMMSPVQLFAQKALAGADMHSHWGMSAWNGNGDLTAGDGLRKEMIDAGILLVAMTVIADYPQLSNRGGSIFGYEYASPGSLRRYFQSMASRVVARAQKDGLAVVGSASDLKAVLAERKPAIALTSEGADFLEGKLDYLAEARQLGLCHLQLVHYRISEVGDISTEQPKHKGLSAFGKDLVAACNRLGILVDVAHCNHAGIQQALEISSKPMVYSHGFIASKEVPEYSKRNARGIYVAQARAMAAKGGVIGAFPVFTRTPEAFADYLKQMVDHVGPNHVGIGTDHSGLPSSALSGYKDYPRVAEALAKAGMKDAEVSGIMGGNYIRVLGEAMAV
jgi:membrane dipeptidase